MIRFFSLNALLLYWQQIPFFLQIFLLLLLGLGFLWTLVSLVQGIALRIRTHFLLGGLSQFFDLSFIQRALSKPIDRWGFLPEQGMLPLLDYFVERFATQNELERNFYLLLGPTGSGKTHFLLRLYAKLKQGFFAKAKVRYISLAQMGDLSPLADYDDHPDTVLLLDGLDEDPLVYAHFGERLDQIIKYSRNYQRIILACSHARFAELENLDYAHYTFVGPKESVRFNLCELVPLDGAKKVRPSVRRGVKKYKTAQNKLLQQWPEIAETPLWLESLRLSPVRSEDRYYYQLFAYRIEAELAKLYSQKDAQDAAQRFLEAIAGSMYLQWKEDKALQLELTEVEALATAFGLDWRALQRNILMIVDHGTVIFRHIAYLSFFLSRAAYRDELNASLTHFEGLPMARTFYLEMAWLAFLKQEPAIEQYSYRSRYDKNKRSLSELSAWELPLISRLYLGDLSNKDVRFLRILKHLKGLHLDLENIDWTETNWIENLPSHDFNLYSRGEEGRTQIWQKKSLGGEQKIQALSIHEVLAPELKLSPSLWPKINKGRKDILDLFELSLESLPNDSFRPAETQINAQGEKVQLHRAPLGLLELDLFNEIELYQFSDQSYNAVFTHRYQPTMLNEMVGEILDKLFKTYGEDDRHLTSLNDDDLSQIEDGLWLGRCYTWQNTDFYAYPLYLFMAKPHQLRLVICGLSPEMVSELSS